MMRVPALLCLCSLSIMVSAWALPLLYDLALLEPIDRTHVFYSPVLRKFVYTEQLRHADPQAAEKSEGHHADIVYRDEDGVYYDRLAFEAALPFIYYRNMEMRGLLPLYLDGRLIGHTEIERARRVLELRARDFDEARPSRSWFPLIEANPGQVALLYPTDRFQPAPDGLRFVNADSNSTDTELSCLFGESLREQGFCFPVRHVGGNFTTFKSHEGGVFLTDAQGALFHLLRRDGRPHVRRLSLPTGLVPRHVLVSESRDRLWLGLLVDTRNRIWLVREADFALLELEVQGYDPQRMDVKVLFDPLHITLITSDVAFARAAIFPLPQKAAENGQTLAPLRLFEHRMSRDLEVWQHHAAAALFPFRLTFSSENSILLHFQPALSPHWITHALPLCALLALVIFLIHHKKPLRYRIATASLTLATGIYALLPLFLLEDDWF